MLEGTAAHSTSPAPTVGPLHPLSPGTAALVGIGDSFAVAFRICKTSCPISSDLRDLRAQSFPAHLRFSENSCFYRSTDVSTTTRGNEGPNESILKPGGAFQPDKSSTCYCCCSSARVSPQRPGVEFSHINTYTNSRNEREVSQHGSHSHN